MYSYKERMKAVTLLMTYDYAYTATVRELGYPSVKALRKWYEEFRETGRLHNSFKKTTGYTEEQKACAVAHYFQHGRCYSRTVRMLGYPNRETLRLWCKEKAPKDRKIRKSAANSESDGKTALVKAFYKPEISRIELAESEGVSRSSLYNWKNDYLGREFPLNMTTADETIQKETLLKELNELEEQVRDLQLEKALLEGAGELLKKEQGINLNQLTNKEKTILIDALRDLFKLSDLLSKLTLAKSSYFYQKTVLAKPPKYQQERAQITDIFKENFCAYGYRRMYQSLKNSGKTLSEKIIRRIMKEEKLIVTLSKRKKYSSYAGEITPAEPNLLERDFKADEPNKKWLTDITEFQLPSGKVYLSPIVDCFDGAVITLVERVSKVIITLKPKGRKAKDIEEALNHWFERFPRHFFKSITFDCGKEFSNWKSVSNQQDIDIFFADLGTPSQRALNEHSNGLLRRDGLPKSTVSG